MTYLNGSKSWFYDSIYGEQENSIRENAITDVSICM